MEAASRSTSGGFRDERVIGRREYKHLTRSPGVGSTGQVRPESTFTLSAKRSGRNALFPVCGGYIELGQLPLFVFGVDISPVPAENQPCIPVPLSFGDQP